MQGLFIGTWSRGGSFRLDFGDARSAQRSMLGRPEPRAWNLSARRITETLKTTLSSQFLAKSWISNFEASDDHPGTNDRREEDSGQIE
jgi:hypothetical protein